MTTSMVTVAGLLRWLCGFPNNMQIVPAILEKEFPRAEFKLGQIKGLSNWVQIDVVDGIFSFGKTFNLELLSKTVIDINDMLIDVHLMVKEPVKWLQKCFFVGATRVIGQVEMMNDRNDFVNKTIEIGMEAGLAFDIDSEIDEIPSETDLVLLMARKSGFGTFELNEKIWEKIEKAKKIKKENDLKFKIGIDGGINFENIEKFKNAGVDILYCTSAVFNGNVSDNLDKLNNSAR